MDTVNVYFHQMGGSYLHQSAILPRAWHTHSALQDRLSVCAEGAAFLAEEIVHAVHTGFVPHKHPVSVAFCLV